MKKALTAWHGIAMIPIYSIGLPEKKSHFLEKRASPEAAAANLNFNN